MTADMLALQAPAQWLHVRPGREFLSDEPRLQVTVNGLSAAVDAALGTADLDPAQLFISANRLALMLYRLGDTEKAAALCRAEIAAALRHPSEPAIVSLALDPQVNLLRLAGAAGEIALVRDGFAALQGVVSGRTVDLPDLRWNAAFLAGCDRLTRVRLLATVRNAVVVDPCKIYFRAGETAALLAYAQHCQSLWPGAVAAGVHHAAEAPFLVDPSRDPIPPDSDHDLQQVRLWHIQALHASAARVTADRQAEAVALLYGLSETADLAETGAKVGTRARWRLFRATVHRDLGEVEVAAEHFASAWRLASEAADGRLLGVLSGRRLARADGDADADIRTARTMHSRVTEALERI